MRKCRNCKYFQEVQDIPKDVFNKYGPYDKPDGWCSKIFPRGYVGAGKAGGWKRGNCNGCFQYEEAEMSEYGYVDMFRLCNKVALDIADRRKE